MFIPLGDDNSGRRITPYVVFGLVAANALVWYLQLSKGEAFTYGFSTVPYEITHGVDLTQANMVDIGGGGYGLPPHPPAGPPYLSPPSPLFFYGWWVGALRHILSLPIFFRPIQGTPG